MNDYMKDWGSAIVGAISAIFLAGVYIQRVRETRRDLNNHDRRITAVEVYKVDKGSCLLIQETHKDKFSDGSKRFDEVKQLIKDSNAQNQALIEQANVQHERRYDNLMDLIKIIAERQ